MGNNDDRSRTCGKRLCEKHTGKNQTGENRTWGIRSGHSHDIVAQITSYLQSHPANYCEQMGNGCNQMDTLLELIYQAYSEFKSVETPEFKAIIDPLDKILRSLVNTDEYMNIVFELCPQRLYCCKMLVS